MTKKDLIELIKDLPDDTEILYYDSDYESGLGWQGANVKLMENVEVWGDYYDGERYLVRKAIGIEIGDLTKQEGLDDNQRSD